MDEKERLLYFYYERLQAIRRAQKLYFASVLAWLGLVWVFYWNRPAGSPANLLGMPLSDKSMLGITPALTTILLLALVGSLRATPPAVQLFKETWKTAGGPGKLELETIDSHQNWVDYARFIWARPLGDWVHGVTFLGVIASTFAVGLTMNTEFKGYATFLFTAYCLLCLGLQAVATWKWIAEKLGALRRKD